MSHQDKNLTCADCSRFFTFNAEEQGLCGELGYDQPKRCRACVQSREDARRYTGYDPTRAPLGTVPSIIGANAKGGMSLPVGAQTLLSPSA